MQEDLRQHLGLQKSACASAVACIAEAGQLRNAGRVNGRSHVVTRVHHRPPFSRDIRPSSTCQSEGLKSADNGLQTLFHWAAQTDSVKEGCRLDNRLLYACPGAGVRYDDGSGHRPQRPMSAPAKRQACMQMSHRPYSASRRPRGSSSSLSMTYCSSREGVVPQPKWQGMNAYRHESSAIRTKLSKHRPMSAI
jgi:hypothetical protein